MKAFLIIVGFTAFVVGSMIASIKSTAEWGRGWFQKAEDRAQRGLERKSLMVGLSLMIAGLATAGYGLSL